MSYDIWIATTDVDGNTLEVTIAESQFGGLDVFYSKALERDSINFLERRPCTAALPVVESALLRLVKYREVLLQLVRVEADPDELYQTALTTLLRLVELTHKHPSGIVRVSQ